MTHVPEPENQTQEEALDAFKLRWKDILIEDCAFISIPPGWMRLVEDLLFEISVMGGGKAEVSSLAESFGGLESVVTVRQEDDSEITPYAVTEKYRHISHQTCFECGRSGKRQVIHSRVYVVCRTCEEIIHNRKNNSEKTDTWLDNF